MSEGQHVRYGQPIGTVGDYPNADSDHIHEGLRRYAMGGIFGGDGSSIKAPFVGSYKIGGIAPRDGLAYVHKDEEIVPRDEQSMVDKVCSAIEQSTFHANVQIGTETVAQRVRLELKRDQRQTRQFGLAGVSG